MKAEYLLSELGAFVAASRSHLGWNVTDVGPLSGSTVLDSLGPTAQAHGVYVFASPTGEVLYLGKAESITLRREIKNYLDNPAAARKLGRIWDGPSVRYRYCTMTVRDGDDEEFLHMIRRGEFMVYCLTVDKAKLVGLLELYGFIVLLDKSNGHLPTFNKQPMVKLARNAARPIRPAANGLVR
jgi:hypothetical protein